MVAERGLVDGFLCASSICGPRYTRMAKQKKKFDCSRFDQIHLMKGAGWIEFVKDVEHHGTRTVSDHVPVSLVAHVHPEVGQSRPETYFKMDVADFSRPGVNERVKQAWLAEEEIVRDDRRKWARGWARVKKILQDVRTEKEQERRQEGSLAKEVWWRPKWHQEAIKVLQLADGEITQDKNEILSEIFHFYQTLFSAEQEGDDNRQSHDRSLSTEVSRKVSEIPDAKEIEEVASHMKKNQASGQDGLTADIVWHC
ncbi:hypothetical protein R1sor_014619 [Riccia sorocarpa]|uniref:Uncharacterized protein n=1 Tax=Riccia sorocarpa TaxID=122646 RepID=A0ABD3HDQ9_9MARC